MVIEISSGSKESSHDMLGSWLRMFWRWYCPPGWLAVSSRPGVGLVIESVGGGISTTLVMATSLTLSTQKMVVPVWPQPASPDHILKWMPATVSSLGSVGLIGATMRIQPGVVGTSR